MDRRDFFKTGATAAAAGVTISISTSSSQAADRPATVTPAGDPATSVVMKDYKAEDLGHFICRVYDV